MRQKTDTDTFTIIYLVIGKRLVWKSLRVLDQEKQYAAKPTSLIHKITWLHKSVQPFTFRFKRVTFLGRTLGRWQYARPEDVKEWTCCPRWKGQRNIIAALNGKWKVKEYKAKQYTTHIKHHLWHDLWKLAWLCWRVVEIVGKNCPTKRSQTRRFATVYLPYKSHIPHLG